MADKKKIGEKFDLGDLAKEEKKNLLSESTNEPSPKKISTKEGSKKKSPGRPKIKNADKKKSANMIAVYFSNEELEKFNQARKERLVGIASPAAAIRTILIQEGYFTL